MTRDSTLRANGDRLQPLHIQSWEHRGFRLRGEGMASMACAVAPGLPHHVAQRGEGLSRIRSGAGSILFDDDDYRAYIRIAREECQRFGRAIWAWYPVPNHIHLIAVSGGASPRGRGRRDPAPLFADAESVHGLARLSVAGALLVGGTSLVTQTADIRARKVTGHACSMLPELPEFSGVSLP